MSAAQKILTDFLFHFAPIAAEWGFMLLPLALYLLYLAYSVYRRDHPVLRTGTRNSLELAFAASGFLLVGPPTWILARLQFHSPQTYLLGYLAYVVLLLGWLNRELSRARRTLVIFNINPHDLREIIEGALHGRSSFERAGPSHWTLKQDQTTLHADASYWWRCCTLVFRGGNAGTIGDIRARLASALAERSADDHVVGSVLALTGGVVLLIVAMSFTLFVWYLTFFGN